MEYTFWSPEISACWRPLFLHSIQPELESFRWVESDLVNNEIAKHISSPACVLRLGKICAALQSLDAKGLRGKQKKRVKMKKQMLSRQEITFILFTHLAIEESLWKITCAFSCWPFYKTVTNTKLFSTESWCVLLLHHFSNSCGFSSSLEVALNETEVLSDLLAQIKLSDEFCFPCHSS